MCEGICPKCMEVTELTRHHIFPKRFFGSKKNSPILHLCRECHDLIEEVIPLYQQLSKRQYIQITVDFLKAQQYGKVLQFPVGAGK